MANSTETEKYLEEIVNLIIAFGNGNFDARGEVSESDDPFNAVLSGLNMLGEELTHYKEELQKQTTLQHHIINSIDEVIYAREINPANPDIIAFSFISGSCREITGYSENELRHDATLWTQALHPEDRLATQQRLALILEAGQTDLLTYRFYNKTKNEYRWLEDRITPVKSEDGSTRQIFGSVRDITEQMNVTLQLKEKNELVSRIITSSDQFFYIVSIDPENTFINDFKYLSWQIEEIQGSTLDKIKSSPLGWMNAIHPDDLERVKEVNQVMFSTQKPALRVYRVKNVQTGNYIWLEDYVYPVADENGRVIELYGSVRNIDDRKKTEIEKENLLKELNNKYNELMQFNYIVSHNLRAPVAHILGLAQLLQTNQSEEERTDTQNFIAEAAQSMDTLLYDLNTILSARSALNEKKEVFSLKNIIRDVQNNLRAEIDKSDTTIKVEIAPEAATINSVKSYLQSSVFNLVANGIKYRSSERRPVIEITATKRDSMTVISIKDNGLGMDMELYGDRIFGLYNKFHTEHEGKGLGLYMTKTQIESLGGTVSVNSRLGKGTEFTITLP